MEKKWPTQYKPRCFYSHWAHEPPCDVTLWVTPTCLTLCHPFCSLGKQSLSPQRIAQCWH